MHGQESRRGPLPQLCQRRARRRQEGGGVGVRAPGPTRRALPPRTVGYRGAADRQSCRGRGGDSQGKLCPIIWAEKSKYNND